MRKLASAKTKLIFETADEIPGWGRQRIDPKSKTNKATRPVKVWRQVVVEAKPSYAILRLKGERKGVTITWAGIWSYCVKLEVNRTLQMKASQKKQARKQRAT